MMQGLMLMLLLLLLLLMMMMMMMRRCNLSSENISRHTFSNSIFN